MKKNLFAIAGLITLFCLYSFTSPKGEISQVEDFTKVKLSISAHVILTQGNSCDFEIKAPAEVLEEIVAEVEKGTLVIKHKSKTSWKKIKKLIPKEGIFIYVTMEDVEGLGIAGSGDIVSKELIKADELGLKISGSGDIVLKQLKAGEVAVGINGSGDVKVGGGGASSMDISIKGSGDVDVSSFNVEKVNVRIAGSGDCRLGETSYLKVFVAGSGDISYKGNPKIEKKIAGSGNIKKVK
ncbi:head GIN domain-containing protein [Bacteroidota bacterium]